MAHNSSWNAGLERLLASLFPVSIWSIDVFKSIALTQSRVAFVKWMLISFHTLTSNTWPILLLFVTLVKISLTQGTLTPSLSFSNDDDNPANRRADECKRTSNSVNERRVQLFLSLVCRCHDIRSSRWNETFECLWRWLSNWRSSTQVLSIFHTRILFTLRRLLHDIQGSITKSRGKTSPSSSSSSSRLVESINKSTFVSSH